MYTNELYHHGIKGQKWGVRRFQNPDGTLTEEGRRRRQKNVFVSGSSKTEDSNSEWYRPTLDNRVSNFIDKQISKGNNFIIGDAPGIDSQVQKYLASKMYENVEVYTSEKGIPRNFYNNNLNWKINNVNTDRLEYGTPEFLAAKDIAMQKAADIGLAVPIEGGAKATRRNVQALIDANKKVKVVELRNS